MTATATLGLRRKVKERPTLSDTERVEIAEAFALFDGSGAGTIDYHDLKVALKALGFEVRKAEVRSLMASHGCGDAADARVDRETFTEILTGKYLSRDPEEEWRKAFAIFDESGEGRITLKNLRRVAKELGEPLGDDELSAMIGEYQRCGRGWGPRDDNNKTPALSRIRLPYPIPSHPSLPPPPLPRPQTNLTPQKKVQSIKINSLK